MDEKEKKELEASLRDYDDEATNETPSEAPAKLVDEPAEHTNPVSPDTESPALSPVRQQSKLVAFKTWVATHKLWTMLAGLSVVLLVGGGIVATTDARYVVMNLFGKAAVQVVVTDATTHQPIPEVTINLAGKTATSDAKGILRLNGVAYGRTTLSAKKLAYADAQKEVVVGPEPRFDLELSPVGTRLTLQAANVLSGKAVGSVKASFGGSDALGDSTGKISLVIPPQKAATADITLSADGFNQKKVTVTLAKPSTAVTLTPAGSVYFLSKRTGTINVMKTSLDGSDQKVVLAGTGSEREGNTVLLASRDWKYVALLARRSGENEALYVIDTHDDTLKSVDEGKAAFTPTGWMGHRFVYTVQRQDKQYYEAKQTAVKTYNADAEKLSTVDENEASGDQYSSEVQNFSSVYIVAGGFVYTRHWYGTVGADRKVEVILVGEDGTKKALKSYPSSAYSGANVLAVGPDELYISLFATGSGTGKVVEYEHQQVADSTIKPDDLYNKPYPTKLLSPGGSATFWGEDRDGKVTLLVGDGDGENGKDFIKQGDYSAYGWYGDDYLLVSKGGSELFVIARSSADSQKPLKLTDYHKPSYSLSGYGYGYGGL